VHPAHIEAMSTQSIVRVPAGISDGTRKGGQFAAHAHAADDGVELTSESSSLPEWSEDELEVDLADALQGWTSKIRSGQTQRITATEVLGLHDQKAMFAAYGSNRGDFLNRLAFTATAENYTAFAGNQYEPEEESRRGNLRVHVGFKQIADIDFEEDGPDIYGQVLAAAPAA
jgi:hypothetical protein